MPVRIACQRLALVATGRDAEQARKRNPAEALKPAKKRGESQLSTACCVGRRRHVSFITVYSNHSIPYFRDIFLCVASSRALASSAALSSSKKSSMPPGITIAKYLDGTFKG